MTLVQIETIYIQMMEFVYEGAENIVSKGKKNTLSLKGEKTFQDKKKLWRTLINAPVMAIF